MEDCIGFSMKPTVKVVFFGISLSVSCFCALREKRQVKKVDSVISKSHFQFPSY